MNNSGLLKDKLKFGLTSLVIIYLLTNFVLPASKYVLNISILADTFKELELHYNFIFGGLKSISIIYISFSVILSLFLVFIYVKGEFFKKYENSFYVFSMFSNLPLILAVVGYSLLIDGVWGELILLGISGLILLIQVFLRSCKYIPNEYFEISKSLRIENNGFIYFKRFLPFLKDKIINVHIKLWSVLIIYEFVTGNGFFGVVLSDIIEYRDFSKFIVIAFSVSLTIVLFNFIIKTISKKFINWDYE